MRTHQLAILAGCVLCCTCIPRVGYTYTFTYDNLQRLTGVAYGNGASIAYTYDAAGNRLSLVSQTAMPSDHTAPVIQITQPTTERVYVTTASSVTLSGTASDASGLAALSCTNACGAQGATVSGTSTWTAGPIALSNGLNKLTVSASDPIGNVGRASLTVVVLPPDTGSQVIFQDDFNDNSMDVEKWTNGGSTVAESGQIMQVFTTQIDQGGYLNSIPFLISTNGLITITRKVFLHHDDSRWFNGRNKFFWGKFVICFGSLPAVTICYDDLSYDVSPMNATSIAKHGFFISRNGVGEPYLISTQADVSPAITPIWDTWFDEKITYNPGTGLLDYYINGTNQMTYFVGTLPSSVDPITMNLYFDACGWWTVHEQFFDDLLVTQADEMSPVKSRDTDLDGMPDWAEILAGTSPTNPVSRLMLQSGQPAVDQPRSFTLEWASMLGTYYSVNRATNLLDAPNCFFPLKTNIPGLSGTTTYTDTNVPAVGPAFYRVNVDY